MADFNVAWTQRIQVAAGFLYASYVPVDDSLICQTEDVRRSWSWKNLKRRLIRWKVPAGHCGPAINTEELEEVLTMNIACDDDDEYSPLILLEKQRQQEEGSCSSINIDGGGGGIMMMNLATALLAERRGINVCSSCSDHWMTAKPPPLKSMNIVRRHDHHHHHHHHHRGHEGEAGGGIGGSRIICCFCTERNKGAVLIPCGHTYCKVCSTSMWSKQQPCPLCNRLILDILQIY